MSVSKSGHDFMGHLSGQEHGQPPALRIDIDGRAVVQPAAAALLLLSPRRPLHAALVVSQLRDPQRPSLLFRPARTDRLSNTCQQPIK